MNNKRELSVAQYITNSLFELMKVKPYNDTRLFYQTIYSFRKV